jgi:hypothetical protein
MGFLDRFRPSSGGGVTGTALVKRSEPLGNVADSDATVIDLATDHFGSRRYVLLLEVHLPGREPFEVEGKFKVPNRALGSVGAGGILAEGIELPVEVSETDPNAVEIDWDAYRSAPGRKQQQKTAQESRAHENMRKQLERNPKMAEKLRAGNRQAVQGWAAAVRGGGMSREEFEREVAVEVATGRMDPADADAARATLDD